MIQASQVQTVINRVLSLFKGDKYIWMGIMALCAISALAVYSSTMTFAYKNGGGPVYFYSLKHISITALGVGIMFLLHRINYIRFSAIAPMLFGISVLLLILTIFFGDTLNSASRWITIPIVNISFQTSDLAKVMLIVYMARFMKNQKQNLKNLKKAFIPLLGYISIICGLIFPNDFSSSVVLFTTCIIIMFIGGLNLKYIGAVIVLGVFLVIGSYLIATVVPDWGRLGTVKNRIDHFIEGETETYQVEQSKIAIARGGIIGKGPGNSTQRNYLPHPYSDFIYAIILEEYGLLGGGVVLFIYLMILFRVIKLVNRCNQAFGAYLALGLAVFLVFQAFINMGVAVNLFPVTGLTLPMISMGGTSVIFVSFALGMIQSVARYVDKEKLDKQKKQPYAA